MPDDGRTISRNVAHLKILVHDVKNLLYYIFVNFTDDYTPSWLSRLHDLILSRLLFKPASDWRKTNKGWGCVEKLVETEISIKYIKNNLQQLKEFVVFDKW